MRLCASGGESVAGGFAHAHFAMFWLKVAAPPYALSPLSEPNFPNMYTGAEDLSPTVVTRDVSP